MPKYKRGSGSVYLKRGWCYIKYYVNGKPVTEATRTKDKAEARRQLRSRLGQVADGCYVGPAVDRVTFEDLTALILEDYRVNNRTTLSWVQRRIRRHLAPTFGGKRAHEISTADVKAFIVHRKEQGAANGEINLELATLKRMFNLAIRGEKIARKPYIPMLAETTIRQGFFERAEFEALLPHLPEFLRPPLTFAYLTGWRIKSEVLPLSWSQVDLDVGTVRLEVGTTKNRDARVIYLPNDLIALLEAQWQEHLAHYPACPFVFHRYGKRIFRIDPAWRKAREAAGLLAKIPHDFRRTAVRNMVRAGIPERVAMQITGHKTRAIFDRYHIVADGDLKEAAKRLSASIPSPTVTISATIPPADRLSH